MKYIKKLLLDSLYFIIGAYIFLYILEFIKPGIVSNYTDLNKIFICIFIYIILVTIISQIKKIK